MGRPKGSKNKSKNIVSQDVSSETIPEIATKMANIPVKKKEENRVIDVDSNLSVETQTINGTPVIIISICGVPVTDNVPGTKCVTMFMVIARPNKNAYKTTVVSNSLVEPKSFPSPEIQKEFEAFQWADTSTSVMRDEVKEVEDVKDVKEADVAKESEEISKSDEHV